MDLTTDDQEYWDCKEQFYDTMKKLAEEFYGLQKSKFTDRTAQNYYIIANAWVEYLYGYTHCLSYKDISIAQTNSHFWSTTRYQELYDFDSKEVKSKLKVFVAFLKERGYENPNVNKAIAKK